jgi:methionine salvage enolase-phosphatase E1
MNRLVRNVISTVQEVAFDYSAKKLHAFFDERDADATTKEHMEERTALQTLCEMRWTRFNYTVKCSNQIIIIF